MRRYDRLRLLSFFLLMAIVQYWLGGDDVEKFAFELSYRLRQDILVKPFTRIFDYSNNGSEKPHLIRSVRNSEYSYRIVFQEWPGGSAGSRCTEQGLFGADY